MCVCVRFFFVSVWLFYHSVYQCHFVILWIAASDNKNVCTCAVLFWLLLWHAVSILSVCRPTPDVHEIHRLIFSPVNGAAVAPVFMRAASVLFFIPFQFMFICLFCVFFSWCVFFLSSLSSCMKECGSCTWKMHRYEIGTPVMNIKRRGERWLRQKATHQTRIITVHVHSACVYVWHEWILIGLYLFGLKQKDPHQAHILTRGEWQKRMAKYRPSDNHSLSVSLRFSIVFKSIKRANRPCNTVKLMGQA